jgi:hypothetical protein
MKSPVAVAALDVLVQLEALETKYYELLAVSESRREKLRQLSLSS